MASHYVSLNRGNPGFKFERGKPGFKHSDFTTGTSPAADDRIELRVPDGAGFSKTDVHLALSAFQKFFESAQLVSAAGFDVTG